MYLIFHDIGIDVTSDKYTIIGCNGIGLAHIIRNSGAEEHVHFKVDKEDPNIMNIWDPTVLSVEERRTYVLKLHHNGMRNNQIAALLNVSQSTICQDLKYLIFDKQESHVHISVPHRI